MNRNIGRSFGKGIVWVRRCEMGFLALPFLFFGTGELFLQGFLLCIWRYLFDVFL